jgi:hypothetical protein
VVAVLFQASAADFAPLMMPKALPASFEPAYEEASKHIVERTYEAAQDLRTIAEFFDEENEKYLDYMTNQVVARLNIQSARKVYRIIFLLLYESITTEDASQVIPCIDEHNRILREYVQRRKALIGLKTSADRFMQNPLVEDDVPSASREAAKRFLSDYYACGSDIARLSNALRELEVHYAKLMSRRDAMIVAEQECLVRIERAGANDIIVSAGSAAVHPV